MNNRPSPVSRESSYSSYYSTASSSYGSSDSCCESEPVTRNASPLPAYRLPASDDASTAATTSTTADTRRVADVLSPIAAAQSSKRLKTFHPYLQDRDDAILVADSGFDYSYPYLVGTAAVAPPVATAAAAGQLPLDGSIAAINTQDDSFFNDLYPLDQNQIYSIFSPIPNTYFPDISSVMSRYSSGPTSSPVNQTSVLTTQIQAATPQPTQQEFFKNTASTGPISINTAGNNSNNNMTSRPIAMAVSPNNRRDERNPLSGSLLGGMSWGGISVGSFIRDDVMMGTSPYSFQSPSFHSSSYLPKMEANFMKDYACCGIKLDSLHELLEHYEEEHAAVPNQTMGRTPTGQQSYAKIDNHHHHLPNPAQLHNGNGNLPQPPRSHVVLPPLNQVLPPHTSVAGDLDDLDSMDMDDGPAPAVQPVNAADRQFQPQPQFGRQPTQTSVVNAFQNPRTTPPAQDSNGQYHNPTVSSANAPNMDSVSRNPGDLELNGLSTPRMAHHQSEGDYDMSSLEGTPNQQSQATIDDPAKRLFSKQGFGAMRSPGMNQFGTPSVNGTMIMPDVTKQFRCPVIGCDKAYKNQNGLKYHKQHGHQNQQLKENLDGSFSIVDPTTSIPYPGTSGMEKEKPYKCDVCSKRYKNLNGLKYHRTHTPMCNTELNMGMGGAPLGGMPGLDGPMAVAQGVNVAGAGLVGETALGF